MTDWLAQLRALLKLTQQQETLIMTEQMDGLFENLEAREAIIEQMKADPDWFTRLSKDARSEAHKLIEGILNLDERNRACLWEMRETVRRELLAGNQQQRSTQGYLRLAVQEEGIYFDSRR